MELNPHYEDIGKEFVQQYYSMFDDPSSRANVVNFYSPAASFMTFEGHQIQGATSILEKVKSLSFEKITRIVTIIDSQPMCDGGVLIHVLGHIKCGEDLLHSYSQVFVLRAAAGSYYVTHDIFRLNIQNPA